MKLQAADTQETKPVNKNLYPNGQKKNGEPNQVNHPPKDPKPQVNVICRQQR